LKVAKGTVNILKTVVNYNDIVHRKHCLYVY